MRKFVYMCAYKRLDGFGSNKEVNYEPGITPRPSLVIKLVSSRHCMYIIL